MALKPILVGFERRRRMLACSHPINLKIPYSPICQLGPNLGIILSEEPFKWAVPISVREWLPFSQMQGFDHDGLIRTSSATHLITTDKLRRGD